MKTRQLAAILFADIVGYTAMMGRDEDKALESVHTFKGIAFPLVKERGGQWHKDLGDGALCSFSSGLDAVECAIAIQNKLAPVRIFKVRIGIHLGDITFSNGDVFGDGVNIASRLQGEAAPGGICVSESINKVIRSKGSIQTDFIGKRKLKNVDDQIGIYQIVAPGLEAKSRFRKSLINSNLAIALILLAAVISGITTWFLKPGSEAPESGTIKHLQIELPAAYPLALKGTSNTGTWQTAMDISPDGSALVYVSRSVGRNILVYHPMDKRLFQPMAGTVDPLFPFFSPDGNWIAYFSGNYLYKVDPERGSPVKLTKVTNPYGGFWSEDNKIIYGSSEGTVLYALDPVTGEKEQIIDLSTINEVMNWPSYIPETGDIIGSNGGNSIMKIDQQNQELEMVVENGGYYSRYVPSGHIVYTAGGTMYAIPYDLENGVLAAHGVPVLDNVRIEAFVEPAQFSFSREGTLIYVSGASATTSRFIRRSIYSNDVDTLPIPADNYAMFTISPDNSKLAISKNIHLGQIYIWDIIREQMEQVTDRDEWFLQPLWSPDGNSIVYTHITQQDTGVLFEKRLYPRGGEQLIISRSHGIRPYSFRKNSGQIGIFSAGHGETARIELVTPNDPSGGQPLVQYPTFAYGPAFSPNGNYFAYQGDETGRYAVYVEPYPPDDRRWQVSQGQGFDVLWSDNGDFIYYRSDDTWYRVPVDTGSEFSFSAPEELFNGEYVDVASRSFDVSADGSTFYLLDPVNKDSVTYKINVIVNWFDDLNKKAPASN